MSKRLPLAWKRVKRRGKLEDGQILKVTVDLAASAALTAEIAGSTVLAYVDPTHLSAAAKAKRLPRADVFAQILPTKPHLKSGDFGEIFVSAERATRDPEPAFHLFRWRERSTPDDTVRGVDLLGVVRKGASPSKSDVLVLVEVKTRSSKRKKKSIVRDAYNGVTKEYATRMTSSLLFTHLKLQRQVDVAALAALERFMVEGGKDYRVLLVAAVVHNAAIWDDSFLDELPQTHGQDADVEVQVACVENLAGWIEAVRAEAVRLSGTEPAP